MAAMRVRALVVAAVCPTIGVGYRSPPPGCSSVGCIRCGSAKFTALHLDTCRRCRSEFGGSLQLSRGLFMRVHHCNGGSSSTRHSLMNSTWRASAVGWASRSGSYTRSRRNRCGWRRNGLCEPEPDGRDGDDEMFRDLLDGSRAANRQGWRWVVGATRNRSYGFSRHQVLKRAPELCDNCVLRDACPIGGYPGSVAGDMIDPAPTMSTDAFGPIAAPRLDLFDADVANASSSSRTRSPTSARIGSRASRTGTRSPNHSPNPPGRER